MKKLTIILLVLLLVGCNNDIEDMNKKALTLINQNNFTEALNVLKEALELDELDDTTWNNISVCYEAIGEYQLALEAAQVAVNNGEEKAAEYANLGNAYFDLDQIEEAQFSFKKALEIDEEYFYALFGMGMYYNEIQDHETALGYFEDLYENNPMNVEVVKMIAFSNYKLGKIDASIAFLEREIEKVVAPELEELLELIKKNRFKK